MPQKTWRVVSLTFKDCQKAADLHQKAFFKGWQTSDFHEFLGTPFVLGLKIEENHKLTGYVLWREIKDEAEILTLVIASPYQKQGRGHFLFEKLCDTLRDKKIGNLFLEVAEDNHSAQSFYLKQDFILLGKRPNYYAREGQTTLSALNFLKKIV